MSHRTTCAWLSTNTVIGRASLILWMMASRKLNSKCQYITLNNNLHITQETIIRVDHPTCHQVEDLEVLEAAGQSSRCHHQCNHLCNNHLCTSHNSPIWTCLHHSILQGNRCHHRCSHHLNMGHLRVRHQLTTHLVWVVELEIKCHQHLHRETLDQQPEVQDHQQVAMLEKLMIWKLD